MGKALECIQTNQKEIKSHILGVLTVSILYSLAIAVANGLSAQGFLPAYQYCMGNSITDSKGPIYVVILPMILMFSITFWYDWRTKQLIKSFQDSPEYNDLRENKDISLLITMGEESTHRATVVSICIVVVYMILLGMLSFSSVSFALVEKLLIPASILLILKDPLTVFWVSTYSRSNFKRIEKEHLAVVYKKSNEEHHELQVMGNNFYEDQLAHNINFEPVAGTC